MVFEVLSAAWRPMTILELRGAMREMFAVNMDLAQLENDLAAGFTRDADGRYGLEDFTWRRPGRFSYIDASYIAQDI